MYVVDMTNDEVMEWIEYLDGDDSQNPQVLDDLDDLVQEAISRGLVSTNLYTAEPTYDPRY